jgi:hypothetical protein
MIASWVAVKYRLCDSLLYLHDAVVVTGNAGVVAHPEKIKLGEFRQAPMPDEAVLFMDDFS